MTKDDFVKQMNRLASVFGAQPYAEERRNLIWKEVNALTSVSFARVVDNLIGSHRQAPLLPEIREEASREREVMWHLEKKQHAQDAKEAMRTLFSSDDIKFFCKTIRERVSGDLNDAQFTGFYRMLKEFPGPPQCKYCEGTGYVWQSLADGGDVVYRCPCPTGDQKPRAIAHAPNELLKQRLETA